MSKVPGNKELIHRLNRISGQIAAIKNNLESDNTDCRRDIEQVKAVTNGMKKFAEAYLENHINECFTRKISPEKMKADLEKVIHSAFNL